jgi:flagellar capping protein FliD
VGRDLDLSINSDTATAQALNAVGITRQNDGTLVVDAAKFAAAQAADPGKVQAALATVGQAVDQSTSAELATGAASDDSMAALAQRSVTLTAQQNALQAAEQQFATDLATQQATDSANAAAGIGGFGDTGGTGAVGSSGYSASYGLAAYISNA